MKPSIPKEQKYSGRYRPAVYSAQRRSTALRSTDGSAPLPSATTAQLGIHDRQTWMEIGGT
jgi:hypothetical protein